MKSLNKVVCKISLLERAPGLKAEQSYAKQELRGRCDGHIGEKISCGIWLYHVSVHEFPHDPPAPLRKGILHVINKVVYKIPYRRAPRLACL